jgi:hypothetical protein
MLLLRATPGLAKHYEGEGRGGGGEAGLAVNILGLVTETGDTCCWSTLRKILLAQLDLPRDLHDPRRSPGADGWLDDRFEIPTWRSPGDAARS